MNNSKSLTQRLLFKCDGPRWHLLSKEMQPQLLEVLSQLLLDTLQRCHDARITTNIATENDHES